MYWVILPLKIILWPFKAVFWTIRKVGRFLLDILDAIAD